MSGETRPVEEEKPRGRLQQYFYGWWFRSSTPSYESGDEFEAYVFDYDDEDRRATVRMGDSRIHIPDVPPEIAGKRIRLRITEYDDAENRGEAEFIETLGETTFG